MEETIGLKGPCGFLVIRRAEVWSCFSSEPSSSNQRGVCLFSQVTLELQLPSVLSSLWDHLKKEKSIHLIYVLYILYIIYNAYILYVYYISYIIHIYVESKMSDI